MVEQDSGRGRGRVNLAETLAIVVLVGVLVPSVAVLLHERNAATPRPRSFCAANLKSIGTGLYTYAKENKDFFPIAAHAPATQPEVGVVAYAPYKIGTHRGDGKDPKSGETTESDTEMSTTRNLWVLVRSGYATPKSFVCPASSDEMNYEEDPQVFWDVMGYKEISYGYQVPYGKKGLPSPECDQRMALAADKGPYGAALEAGQVNPGIPSLPLNAKPDDWRAWNSPNHGQEGQCVLYADSHASFEFTPLVGVQQDNIYTRWSRADGGPRDEPGPRIYGTPPTSNETPWSDTDSLIYP